MSAFATSPSALSFRKWPNIGRQPRVTRQPLSQRVPYGFRQLSGCRLVRPPRRASLGGGAPVVRATAVGLDSEAGRKQRDLFKILEIPTTSSADEIKIAYRRKVKELHPDRNGAEDATERFMELQEAYTILVNEWKVLIEQKPNISSTEMRIHFDKLNREMVQMFNDYYTGIW